MKEHLTIMWTVSVLSPAEIGTKGETIASAEQLMSRWALTGFDKPEVIRG